MTEPSNGNCNIRPVRGETTTAGSLRGAIRQARSRIEEAGIELPIVERADGLEVEGQHQSAAEKIVDNCQVNREARSELYLSFDPVASNCPRHFPGAGSDL